MTRGLSNSGTHVLVWYKLLVIAYISPMNDYIERASKAFGASAHFND